MSFFVVEVDEHELRQTRVRQHNMRAKVGACTTQNTNALRDGQKERAPARSEAPSDDPLLNSDPWGSLKGADECKPFVF